MIVLYASAAVDWLLQTSAGQSIEKRIYSRNETLHAPHLLDLEVTRVLRRLALQGGSRKWCSRGGLATCSIFVLPDILTSSSCHEFGKCVTIFPPTTLPTLCLPKRLELR
jgi:hypothetical protein